jgi:prepilin-type N-terminal cleavage/methylation domain-containing protein
MNRKAFTLIETLVAIALLSVVITIAAYSFRFSTDIIKFLKTPSLQELENLSRLRDSLNSLFFFLSEDEKIRDIEKKFSFFFKGNSHYLVFITTRPFVHKRDSLYLLEVKFNNGKLEVREYPVYDPLVNYKNPSIPSKVSPVILLSEIKDLNIEYLKDGKWQNVIKGEIPELIKFTYKDKRGEKRILTFRVQSDFYYKKEFCKFLYSPF